MTMREGLRSLRGASAALLLLLPAFPGSLLAQETARAFSLLPPDQLHLAFDDRSAPAESCGEARLSSSGSGGAECWSRAMRLAAADAPAPDAAASGEKKDSARVKKPRRVLGTLMAVGASAATAANSYLGYDHQPFHIHHEGFFGARTQDGGADKASHFADYHIAAKEMINIYRLLGYSETEALLTGFAAASVAGLVNEIGDGYTRHGFSPQDLLMDVLGAGTATVIQATRTGDLVGVRTSHLPGATYIHDVYSADLKIAGLARRLGINLGPLRYLLFSVTYGVKGYRNNAPPDDQERQVGVEIGLNLEEVLNTVGARRDTWWGYALHVVGDNVRFPYLNVGFRYDLNHAKWHGPNIGNYP